MSKQITTKIVDITPTVAKDILAKNNHNRPISSGTVSSYSRMMKDGKWNFNGENIIIAEDGSLLDGQHRLHAIINSSTTQKMVVVSGVERSAFSTIDIGKKRSVGDALATYDEKYRKSAAIIGAAVITIMQFDENYAFDEKARGKKPSHDEVIDWVNKNRGILRSVDLVSHLHGAKKLVPYSALCAIHYLMSKRDINKCELYFNKLNSGENLKIGDPIMTLRNKLIEIRYAGGIFRTREVMPYLLKAWEAMRKEKTMERMRIDADYIPTVI